MYAGPHACDIRAPVNLYRRLEAVVESLPNPIVISTTDGDVEGAYQAILASIGGTSD